MKKHHLLFLLGLIASAAPNSVEAKGTYRNTVKRKKTKSLRAHKPDYLRNGAIVAGVVLVGGFAAVCYRNRKGKKTNPEKDPTKQKKHLGDFLAGDSTLMGAVKEYVKSRDPSMWRTWILDEVPSIKALVKNILQKKGIDLGSENTGHVELMIPEIEYGGIDGKVVPLQMAVILAQVLHLLEKEKGPIEALKIVRANNNRFLANLVIRHDSNAQKVDEVQDGKANCIPAIFVLLNLGDANPEDKPEFGESGNSPFKDGDKTIIDVAEAKEAGKAISIEDDEVSIDADRRWNVKPITQIT